MARTKAKANSQRRKALNWFRSSFGLQDPFTVLVDGNVIEACLRSRINLNDQLAKELCGKAHSRVTQCVSSELDALGKPFAGAKLAARRHKRLHCNHAQPCTPAECFTALLRAKRAYAVATQDPQLQQELAEMGGVPVLSVQGKKLALHIPPRAQRDRINELKEKFGGLSKGERRALAEARFKTSTKRKTHKKRSSGPNPLSCQPKKRKQPTERDANTNASGHTPSQRSRHRSRAQKRAARLRRDDPNADGSQSAPSP